MKRNPDTASGGFTLVELLLAGAILAVLSAMAVPAFRDDWRRRAPERALEDVAVLASYAKDRAVLEGRPYRLSAKPGGFVLEAADHEVWEAVSVPVRALPAGLTLKAEPETITFLPDGTSSAGSVFLEKAGRSVGRLEIDAAFAEARRIEV